MPNDAPRVPRHRTLDTARLTLRRPAATDAEALYRLIDDPTIAAQTLTIPHPYPREMADTWIAHHHEQSAAGNAYTFVAIAKATGDLVGAIGLSRDLTHHRAELGYWIGRPYWRRGYATEAATAVVAFGFTDLACHRVTAQCYVGNAASRRVLEQAGLLYEGTRRGHIKKPDGFRDVELFGILRTDWEKER